MGASFHHKPTRYNVETHRVRWCALVSPPATVATSTACVPGNHFVEAHTTSRSVATIPGTLVSNTHAWLMTRTCCVDRRVKCTASDRRVKCTASGVLPWQVSSVICCYTTALYIRYALRSASYISRYKYSDCWSYIRSGRRCHLNVSFHRTVCMLRITSNDVYVVCTEKQVNMYDECSSLYSERSGGRKPRTIRIYVCIYTAVGVDR